MNKIQTYIFKRSKAGSYRIRWKDPITGQWKAMSGGRTRDEAKILEAKVRESILKGIAPDAKPEYKKVILSDVVKTFFEQTRYLGASDRWKQEARYKINCAIVPELGKLSFDSITKERVFKFYLKLKDQGLSHATIEKHHHLLCAIGDVYTETTKRSNPFREIRDFKKRFPNQPSTRDINFLTPDEIESLIEGSRKTRKELMPNMIQFLAHSGLRRSEALNLKWSDIDLKSDLIHIRKSKNGKSRIIPLEEKARFAIIELKNNGEYVFTKSNGSRYDQGTYLRYLKMALKRTDIQKRIDVHSLRHSFGSNKIRQGWGLKKVSRLLGHSNINITANVYSHLLDGDLKVRDDITFENESKPKSEMNVDLVAKVVTQKIAQVLLNSKNGIQSVEKLISSFEDSQMSTNDSQDVAIKLNQEVYAPLVLHPLVNAKSGRTNPDAHFSKTINDYGILNRILVLLD